ncbi:MAG: PIN domain-containing protein [Candidatus Woesearchaeota archaeon]
MKLAVDANVLFALAKHSSAASAVQRDHKLVLLAQDFALLELYKYKEEISSKSGQKFERAIESIRSKVTFVDSAEYASQVKPALSLLSDAKDAACLALALTFKIPIWSNDRHLKEQSVVAVFTTLELITLLSKA